METFLKASAAALIAAILALSLWKQGKDVSVLLSIAACAMILIAAASYFEPVFDFLEQLQQLGQLDGGAMRILLKAVGIGLLAQIVGMICADAGNSALGKTLQILAGAAVLWLAMPLLQGLMDLVQKILGEV